VDLETDETSGGGTDKQVAASGPGLAAVLWVQSPVAPVGPEETEGCDRADQSDLEVDTLLFQSS
jgi:hypothetical protein